MPRVRLTEAFVARAQHKASENEGRDRKAFWCEQERGFGLIITAGGNRSYVFQWRNGTRQCRLNLDGRFARLHEQERKDGHGNRASPTKVLSPLASARREATLVRAAIAQGRDPLEEVRTARQSGENTLQAVIEIYLRRETVKLRRPSARPGSSSVMCSAFQGNTCQLKQQHGLPACGSERLEG